MAAYWWRTSCAALLWAGSGDALSAQEPGAYAIVPASEIGSRAVVGAGKRVDRRVVSPFPADRRIIVRPAGLVEAASMPAAPVPVGGATPAPAPAPQPLAGYVNIGPLDAPLPVPDGPAPGGDYIDIGPYSAPKLP